MDMSKFFIMLSQTAEDKGLNREKIVKIIEESLKIALSKVKRRKVDLKIDYDDSRGILNLYIAKKIVDEVVDPETEVSEKEVELKNYKTDFDKEDQNRIAYVPFDFNEIGRNVIFRFKDIFIQKLREAERERIYQEYEYRIGAIVTGKLQKFDRYWDKDEGRYKWRAIIALRKVDAYLPEEEMIEEDREQYKVGSTVKAMVAEVIKSKTGRAIGLILSRTHPGFVKGLLTETIPEILEGRIEIKKVVRIPGKRAKVAVYSNDPYINPVSLCVGRKGSRINSLKNELRGEQIDIIKWDSDPLKLAANALSIPKKSSSSKKVEFIRPLMVYEKGDLMVVVFPEEYIGEAKGVDGVNVKLASMLVGKEIEIVSPAEEEKPENAVGLNELNIPEDIKNKLREEGMYVFKTIPVLAEFTKIKGISEAMARDIIDQIEKKLKEKGLA